MLGLVGFTLLIASSLAAWPVFDFDQVRRPFAMLGVALLLFEAVAVQRRGRPQFQVPGRLAACIDVAVALHLFTVLFVVNMYEAIAGLFPIVAGYVAFKAVARGWIDRDFLEKHGMLVVAAVALLFSGYGVSQSVWGDHWPHLGGAKSPVSTMGNTNYAGILSAVFAVACTGAALSKGRPLTRIACSLAAFVGALHVGYSDSRAALLGVLAGGAAVAFVLVWTRQARAATLVVFVMGLAFLAPRVDTRVVPIVGTTDRTARIRLGLWKGTLKLWAANPILGCGVGNFRIAFPPYRDPDERDLAMADKGGAFPFAEDPHSTPLKVLSEAGPLALLALGAAFITVLHLVIATSRVASPGALSLMAAGTGGLVCFFVSGLFNGLSAHLPFVVLAGCFAGFCIPPVVDPKAHSVPLGLQIAALLAGVAWLAGSVLYFAADVNYRAGMLAAQEGQPGVGDPKKRLEKMRAALEILDIDWQARFQAARCHILLQDAKSALAEYRRVLEVNPHHFPSLKKASELLAGTPEGDALREKAKAIAPEYYESDR